MSLFTLLPFHRYRGFGTTNHLVHTHAKIASRRDRGLLWATVLLLSDATAGRGNEVLGLSNIAQAA